MATDPVYERPVTPVAQPSNTVASGPARSPWASQAARFVLSLLGAAGLIVGALLDWLRSPSQVGTKIDVRFLWSTTAGSTDTFVRTVGFVAIVLGLLAVLGLAMRSGWLTRVAGALGIVEFVLFAITVSRDSGMSFPSDIGVGAWLALAGGVVALAGGLLGTRRVVTTSSQAVPPAGTTTTVVD